MNIAWNEVKNGEVPELKRGQKVTYELYGLKKDPMDPEKDERKKRLQIPFKVGIPPTDRVHWGKGDKGEWVDIAYIKGYGNGGVPLFGEIQFDKVNAGTLTLVGGKGDDDRKYKYLEMCNFNGSNPFRDTSMPIIFTRKDYKKERDEKRKKRDLLVDAITTAKGLDLATLRKMSIGIYGNVMEDDEEMRIKIENFAEARPTDFLAMYESNDLNIMELGAEAQKKGILSFDMQARKILSSGNTIYTWSPDKGAKPLEKFVDFVKSEEGHVFYNELKEKLKKK